MGNEPVPITDECCGKCGEQLYWGSCSPADHETGACLEYQKRPVLEWDANGWVWDGKERSDCGEPVTMPPRR